MPLDPKGFFSHLGAKKARCAANLAVSAAFMARNRDLQNEKSVAKQSTIRPYDPGTLPTHAIHLTLGGYLMTLKTIDLKPKVGTELQAPREEFLNGAHADKIRDLLEERGVLIIRGIHFNDEEQLQFAKTLGELVSFNGQSIFKISLDPKTNPQAAEYLKGSLLWHIDGAMDDVPSRGSILTARQLPENREGNTETANTFAAFADLPPEEQARLEKLKVVHTMASSQRKTYPNATPEQIADWERYPPKIHPLVWTHRSGRKSLVIGVSADYIEGMDIEEGRALLKKLDDFATQDEYVYSHEWTVGDLLIWDNTVSIHRAAPYSPTSGRLMHRVTLVGEEPLV